MHLGNISMALLWACLALLAALVNSQDSNKYFSCEGRPTGYYADVTSGCQIYHMCDDLGRQFSYSCPNTTLFQQRMLICDHWYMVNCSKSEVDYKANLLIGQKEKPFVEDDIDHPYHRTPRPDLLAHPSAAEYNIIYRMGKSQQSNNQNNLVGANRDDNDKTAYFLPSHWSTGYPKGNKNTKKPKEKAPVVNFASNFQATTPVYPKHVDPEIPLGFDELPLQNNGAYGISSVVEPPKSSNDVQVNFQSNFKATTPVYPKFVDPKTILTNDDLPVGGKSPLDAIQPPVNNIQTPSIYYETPYNSRSSTERNWKELQKAFFIPDYQFPLDASASRPSYDDKGPNSFDVNPFSRSVMPRQGAA